MKNKIILLAAILFIAGCAQVYTIEDSEKIARDFVADSPTYSYDGYGLNLIEQQSLECRECFLYLYSFNSTQAGYGDRSGAMSAQVITPHLIDVVVAEGKVVQALIDNEWDEIAKENVKTDYSEGSGVPVFFCTDMKDSCSDEADVVCTREKIEYKNGCMACQNDARWYTKGKCNQGYTDKALEDLSKGKITKESSSLIIFIGWNID